MSMGFLTYQQSVFKRYHSDEHFSEFYPQNGGKQTTGIDTEQNYVTVTLCIMALCLSASRYCIYAVVQKTGPLRSFQITSTNIGQY